MTIDLTTALKHRPSRMDIKRGDAVALMGRFDAEIDVVTRQIRGTGKAGTASLTIPSTGKTLWVYVQGCVTTFQVEV